MKQYLYIIITVLIPFQVLSQGQWNIYNTNNSNLPSNFISFAAKDSNKLWVATASINSIYTLENQVFNHWDSASFLGTESIHIDKEGNKWIGMQTDVLFKVNTEDSLTQVFTNVFGAAPRAISEDRQGNIWVATSFTGISMYDHSNWVTYDTSNSSIPCNEFFSIVNDTVNEFVWLGSISNGLVKFDGTNWTTYNSQNSPIPNNAIITMTIDGSGKLWLGTPSGLVSYDGTNWQVYTTSNSSLQGNYVYSLNVEKDSILWIGYAGSGISRKTNTSWKHYNTTNSPLPDNQINKIEVEATGKKWFCTGSGGLVSFIDSSLLSDVSTKLNNNEKELFRAYPNPFSQSTLIQFDLDKLSRIELDIYSSDGKHLRRLMDEELDKGVYEISFKPKKQYAGYYYCSLKINEEEISLKLLRID